MGFPISTVNSTLEQTIGGERPAPINISYKYYRHIPYPYLLSSFRPQYISVCQSICRHLNLLSLKLRQKASQSVLCKVIIKGKAKHIKFDNNFVFRIWCYSGISIYPKNVKTFPPPKKIIKKNNGHRRRLFTVR